MLFSWSLNFQLSHFLSLYYKKSKSYLIGLLQGLNELLCLRRQVDTRRHLAQSLRLGTLMKHGLLLFSALPALFLLFLMVDGSYPHSHTLI